MSDGPAVSVVLPTHQRRELVRRAVGSVLAQTFTDFELIVVDDGSTDGTGEVLRGVDDRLRYVWQENAGAAAARNRALELARAPVVAFLDDDNRWLPEHLAVVTGLLARHPRAAVVSTCRWFLTTGRDRPGREAPFELERGGLLFAAAAGYMSCMAVRREALVAIGGFDPELAAAEDTDLLQRLGTVGPVVSLRRRTVVRHTTPGSLGASAWADGRYLAGAERGAENLVAATRALPAKERERLEDQARGSLHLARAITAVAWGADDDAIRTHLAIAADLVPPAESAYSLTTRVRRDLPRSGDPRYRLEVLTRLAELWPRREDDAPRYLRLHALGFALRLGRFGVAARMVAGWRGRGKVASARRVAPLAVVRVRRNLQERRFRGPAGS